MSHFPHETHLFTSELGDLEQTLQTERIGLISHDAHVDYNYILEA